MDARRVVVTGVGLVTPLGNGRERTWSALLEGRSGLATWDEGLEGRVIDFSPNGARSRMGDFALLATREALDQAGLLGETEGTAIGCALSQSKPLLSHGSLDPTLLMSSFFGWSAEALVMREFGLAGPAGNIAAACATGVASLELAAHWVRRGVCDIAIAGASESSLHPLYRAGFAQLGVLAPGDRADAVRPFDKARAGFAMGEGAAAIVLESEASAERRGARALARLGDVALRHSANDPIRFDPDGRAVADLIRRVSGDRAPGYINAHGTATPFNDAVETKGILTALGPRTAGTIVSSTKAATGHLLGAAGAVEAAFCILALRDQAAPPTLHLSQPEGDGAVDFIANRARRTRLDSAISLSYGFGGQMGAVLFERAS